MPPQQGNPRPQNNSQIPIDAETFRAIVDQQSKKVELELRRVSLEEKRLDADTKLAEKSMELNASLMQKAPTEHRRTTKTYAILACVIIVIIMAFIVVCLYMGKQDFLLALLKGLKDFAIAVLSFVIGRKTVTNKKDSKSDQNIPEAEVID